MKKIGLVDYYISEWHANNYVGWIKEACEEKNLDYQVSYAWAEKDVSPVDGKTTDEWCAEFNVQKCQTIEELCEKSDYIIILAPSNPEKHLSYAEVVLKYKKNTYIDKTFAPDYKTAKKIFDIAEENGTQFFSSSALRYASELKEKTDVKSVITVGGGSNLPEYIIHQLEMVVLLLNDQPIRLKVEKQESQSVCRIEFENDKIATVIFSTTAPFVVMPVDSNGKSEYLAINSDFFKALIEDIVDFFDTGKASFAGKQTLNVAKIREGVIKGINQIGEWINL